jgi:hypothetical protein
VAEARGKRNHSKPGAPATQPTWARDSTVRAPKAGMDAEGYGLVWGSVHWVVLSPAMTS